MSFIKTAIFGAELTHDWDMGFLGAICASCCEVGGGKTRSWKHHNFGIFLGVSKNEINSKKLAC